MKSKIPRRDAHLFVTTRCPSIATTNNESTAAAAAVAAQLKWNLNWKGEPPWE